MKLPNLPVHSLEDATHDFEVSQIHAIWDDTTLGGVLSGKLPNPVLATGIVLQLASTGTVRKVAFGTGSVTFAAGTVSAVTNVAHGLGTTPVSALAGSESVGFSMVTTRGATNITVTGFTASAFTGSVTFDWIAIG